MDKKEPVDDMAFGDKVREITSSGDKDEDDDDDGDDGSEKTYVGNVRLEDCLTTTDVLFNCLLFLNVVDMARMGQTSKRFCFLVDAVQDSVVDAEIGTSSTAATAAYKEKQERQREEKEGEKDKDQSSRRKKVKTEGFNTSSRVGLFGVHRRGGPRSMATSNVSTANVVHHAVVSGLRSKPSLALMFRSRPLQEDDDDNSDIEFRKNILKNLPENCTVLSSVTGSIQANCHGNVESRSDDAVMLCSFPKSSGVSSIVPFHLFEGYNEDSDVEDEEEEEEVGEDDEEEGDYDAHEEDEDYEESGNSRKRVPAQAPGQTDENGENEDKTGLTTTDFPKEGVPLPTIGSFLENLKRRTPPHLATEMERRNYWKLIIVYVAGLDSYHLTERFLRVVQKQHPSTIIVGGVCDEGHVRLSQDEALQRTRWNLQSKSRRQLAHLIQMVTGMDPQELLKEHSKAQLLNMAVKALAIRMGVGRTLTSVRDGVFGVAVGGEDVPVRSVVCRGPRPNRYGYAMASARSYLKDVETTLARLHAHTQSQRQILGAVLYSCTGRGPSAGGVMGHRPMADASLFADLFPDVPCLGFYAGGEIGPSNSSEEGDEELFQCGTATMHGMTCVVCLFIVPRKSYAEQHSLQLCDDSPQTVAKHVASKYAAVSTAPREKKDEKDDSSVGAVTSSACNSSETKTKA